MKELVRNLYKDDGKPFEMTDGQAEIFDAIFCKRYLRLHILAHTRYGKSLVTALAVLTRVSTFPEKWVIVAGRAKQASIIMGYIIEHTFDNPYTLKKLEIGKDESAERLRRERSKNRLVFRVGDGQFGEVYILSAESKNREDAANSLMGFGATGGVVLDEASLIGDEMEAKVFRMMADKPDIQYVKIGNPFFRNHFLKDSLNPKFYKLNFDYTTGMKEGRLTEEFIEEARKKPQFGVLFENKFPDAEAIDNEGWSQLITDKELENALVDLPEVAWFGDRVMGHDVARGGGCYNVWCLRTKNYATIIGKNQDPDLMSTTGTTVRLGKEFNIHPRNWNIDDIGTGGGEVDRLREQRYDVQAVIASTTAIDHARFENKRAENAWQVKEWLNAGGKLDPKCDWSDLLKVKYKAKDSTGRLILMSKDKMSKRGIDSPDTFDALANTFNQVPYNPELEQEQERENEYD